MRYSVSGLPAIDGCALTAYDLNYSQTTYPARTSHNSGNGFVYPYSKTSLLPTENTGTLALYEGKAGMTKGKSKFFCLWVTI
jgi:hypothetical protein